MAKEPDDKKPPHLTVVQMGRTAHAPKQPPRIVIKGHETFEHMGMIATMIDGTVHFFDRSYARSIKRTENTIQQTIERNSYELQGYGTLNLVDKVFSIGGNGAEIPFKAYWLNPDQMMIMLMQSSSEAGIEMRRKMVDLKNDIRDGRLVYADGALVPGQAAQAIDAKAKLLPSPPKKPFDPYETMVTTPTSPELESIQPYDDQILAADLAESRRPRRLPRPEAILTDENGELRMRYSTLAVILGKELYETYYYGRAKAQVIGTIAPVWTREELYGGFMRYHGEAGHHEAPYFTMAQAIAIAIDMDLGHREREILEAFRRYMRVLTNYAEETAKFAAQRAEAEAKLANAPSILGLLARLDEKFDQLPEKVAGIASSEATARVPRHPAWQFWKRG